LLSLLAEQFRGRFLIVLGGKCTSEFGRPFDWSNHYLTVLVFDEADTARCVDSEFVTKLFGNRRLPLARDSDGRPIVCVTYT